MTRVVISLGANLGDPAQQIAAALTLLSRDPQIAVTSSRRPTPPIRSDAPTSLPSSTFRHC
ncbi:hypothetical protein [Propioniciclava flava]